MNIKQFRLVCIFLAVFGLTASYMAQAQEVKVFSADPASAIQGTLNLDVTIGGEGFDNSAAVQFLVSGTPNPGGIVVKNVKVRGSKKIIVNIDVMDNAEVADFDIEIQMSRGRGGKGTTLFKVLQKSGGGVNDLLTISCDDLFGFTPGTCTAAGTSDPCTFEQPIDNDREWRMTQDCDTHAMLIVDPDDPFLAGGGFRLNLVAPWSGEYAGIATTRGASRISDFHIVVDDPAVAEGCSGVGTVQSAVYFDPDLQPTSGLPRGSVGNMIVETLNDARFCYGIEFVGSDPVISAPYQGTGAGSNHIRENSYERVGIWAANINSQDTDTKRGEEGIFSDNIVEASDSPCAIGMLLANIERLVATGNLVYASSGAACAQNTTGIIVLDSGRNKISPSGPEYDFLEARAADLSANTVLTGGNGSIGIVIDAATTAETSKNQITAGDAGDQGVCVETGANFTEVKKASQYIGFSPGNEIVFVGDCNAAIP